MKVVDGGDVMMFSGDAATSCASLETVVQRVAESGAIPLILGGDHTITWPDVTGVARARGWGRVAVLHFDAHADTGDIEFGALIGHGQPMRRLIESGAARGDRFLQIGLEATEDDAHSAPARTGRDKTSVIVELPDDHPGALLEMLQQFASRGINLTRIESRPIGDRLGRYRFNLDAEGHINDPEMAAALKGLEQFSPEVLFLGSYPRA